MYRRMTPISVKLYITLFLYEKDPLLPYQYILAASIGFAVTQCELVCSRFSTKNLQLPVLFVSPQQEPALGFPWLALPVSSSPQCEFSKVNNNNLIRYSKHNSKHNLEEVV